MPYPSTNLVVPAGYEIQTLPDRYVLSSIVDKFLKGNVGTFGSKWARQVSPMGFLLSRANGDGEAELWRPSQGRYQKEVD